MLGHSTWWFAFICAQTIGLFVSSRLGVSWRVARWQVLFLAGCCLASLA